MAARVSMMAFVALLLVCLAASANVASASHAPEQLRLSLTGVKGEMVVGWATPKDTDDSTVQYSCADGSCGQFVVQGTATHYYLPISVPFYKSPQLHFATLKGLNSSTTYAYRVGDKKKGWSDIYHFTTEPDHTPSSGRPLRIISIGDEGTQDGAKEVLAAMLASQQKQKFGFIIHAGDISYANGKQKIWDRWGQLVQPLAAQVPWMVSPGNHEMHYLGTPYLYRFAMPAAQSGGESGNMYYSFNYGNVHVIALDSEASSFSAQVEWVKKDLRRVDRAVTPWIIGFWHRPWYCSSTVHEDSGKDMRDALEDLFYREKVDLVITGHVHSYERTLPVYKGALTADAPLYITNGVGGNSLDSSWVQPPVWSVQRLSAYGFGAIEIFNSTHLHWTLHASSNSSVIDSVWLVRPAVRGHRDSGN